MHSYTLITLALAAVVSARPRPFGRRAAFTLKNGQDAIALNDQFKTLTATSPCTAGQNACVNQQFAQCVGSTFTLQPCAGGTICAALPLVNSAGTSITCTTQADLDARIAATGATAAAPAAAAPPATSAPPATTAPPAAAPPAAAAPPPAAAAGDDSLTLDASVIQTTDDGQNPPVAGQAAAQTSKNNFINFCAPTLATLPITNGLQTTTGSCNPVPIGQIPSTANIPSAKFQSPTNGATLTANTPFNITLQAKNIQLGQFTNAAKTYFANPQTLNAQGQIIGHTHIVIEAMPSLDSTAVTDATKFVFFKGIDGAADAQGNVQATVAAGLPAGAYRMGTIMSSATHQPVIVPIAQHGLCDDVIYMTVA
ncbi:hypothetical protein B0H16DRAFT_1354563 [Mycena metata]|uniref:Carbohydrate-binding module family 19 domain-containing protein n=1 Tax=Mycena metata TaxID=1033252 RepID=A0AAD7KIQ9_9AGAR|nr:hypothetical protein B0H16DRAFT_1354563 [Mycena metata]